MRRTLAAFCFLLAAARWSTLQAQGPRRAGSTSVSVSGGPHCGADMVRVRGFCIDRWEVRTVDDSSGEPLSPFYPPSPKLSASVRDAWLCEQNMMGSAAARAFGLPALSAFQREHSYEPRAVSEARVVPQAYLSYHLAKKACENAHKRLCSKDEWVTACRGQKNTQFPYGSDQRAGRCNVHRAQHPGYTLHAS